MDEERLAELCRRILHDGTIKLTGYQLAELLQHDKDRVIRSRRVPLSILAGSKGNYRDATWEVWSEYQDECALRSIFRKLQYGPDPS